MCFETGDELYLKPMRFEAHQLVVLSRLALVWLFQTFAIYLSRGQILNLADAVNLVPCQVMSFLASDVFFDVPSGCPQATGFLSWPSGCLLATGFLSWPSVCPLATGFLVRPSGYPPVTGTRHLFFFASDAH